MELSPLLFEKTTCQPIRYRMALKEWRATLSAGAATRPAREFEVVVFGGQIPEGGLDCLLSCTRRSGEWVHRSLIIP